MKRIKVGASIVLLIGILYCMVSYGLFFLYQSKNDNQVQLINQQDYGMQKNDSVVIQNVDSVFNQVDPLCTHDDSKDRFDNFSFDNDPEEQFLITQDQEDSSLMTADEAKNRDNVSPDSYSFVTIPAQDCTIDEELYMTLDALMGKNLDEFVKLVLQSNNNIVSEQACRSCSMYAFFNKIKRNHSLDVQDIIVLQPLLINLYRFVEKMQKLSKVSMMRPEQYAALQNLNRSQAAKNDIKLEQRRAATRAALKKLQIITYNR